MAQTIHPTVNPARYRTFSDCQRSKAGDTLGSVVVNDLLINFVIKASPSLSSFTEEYYVNVIVRRYHMTHVLRIKHKHANPRIAQYGQLVRLLQQPISSPCKRNLQSNPSHRTHSLQLLIFNLLDLSSDEAGEIYLYLFASHVVRRSLL